MRTTRLAQFLAHKYKVAASTADLENAVRKQIDTMYDYLKGTYKIVRDCAMADASNPENEEEELAVKGHKFCKQIVSIVDYLKKERNTIKLPELQAALVKLSTLIDENLKVQGAVQFPHVSALIWAMIPLGQKVKPAYVEKVRKETANKARHGIMRLKSVATTMLDQLEQMGMAKSPASGRFEAERTSLDMYEILNFMRKHGGGYGIEGEGDWEVVFRNDPQLLNDITTIINALQRGRLARTDAEVKAEVLKALREHRARTEGVNTPYFEAGEEQAKEMAKPEQDEEEPVPPTTIPANTNQKASSHSLEGLLRKYQ